MNNLNKEYNYYQVIDDLKLFSNRRRLKYKLYSIFSNISFQNKNVLDIGGGVGLFCFYARIKGADKVVNLEPQLEGSSKNTSRYFHKINDTINTTNVYLVDQTFQNFGSKEQFDVIILHDSINHLNEKACINLEKEETAKITYKKYVKKMYEISSDNSQIIICDCSNRNFFYDVGLKNPLAKNIEWEKHQNPTIWLKLFEEEGFTKVTLKWSSFNRFGKLGSILFGNKIISYFFTSHFCLHVRKKKY